MALPNGFDPRTLKMNVRPVIAAPVNRAASSYSPPRSTSYSSSSYSFTRRRSSWWSRFNSGVASLGNWFAENIDNVISKLAMGVLGLGIITALIALIGIWVENGFWMALLFAIGVAAVSSIAFGVIFGIIFVVCNVVMIGLRLIFWNGWSLLGLTAAALGMWGYAAFAEPTPVYVAPQPVEQAAPATVMMRCTARVLNVRSAPNTYSSVLGTLRKGQTIEAAVQTGDFYRVNYNGHTGYVSRKYLERVN